jgi:hypothetical protein
VSNQLLLQKLLPNASGFYGSLSTKFGNSEKAAETFEVLRSFEEIADEMMCNQMRHCYGYACNLLVACCSFPTQMSCIGIILYLFMN